MTGPESTAGAERRGGGGRCRAGRRRQGRAGRRLVRAFRCAAATGRSAQARFAAVSDQGRAGRRLSGALRKQRLRDPRRNSRPIPRLRIRLFQAAATIPNADVVNARAACLNRVHFCVYLLDSGRFLLFKNLVKYRTIFAINQDAPDHPRPARATTCFLCVISML